MLVDGGRALRKTLLVDEYLEIQTFQGFWLTPLCQLLVGALGPRRHLQLRYLLLGVIDLHDGLCLGRILLH